MKNMQSHGSCEVAGVCYGKHMLLLHRAMEQTLRPLLVAGIIKAEVRRKENLRCKCSPILILYCCDNHEGKDFFVKPGAAMNYHA